MGHSQEGSTEFQAPAAPGRFPRWGGVAAFFVVFAYSWFGDHRAYVADDAGIFLRYAERIAEGKGLSYNDGESVNGASAPLFVFAEAVLLRIGFSPYHAILVIASLCLAGTAGFLFATFARFYSPGAGLFSVLALLAFQWPYSSVVDGMETPFVTLLAAVLFRALHAGDPVPAGLALGALVANKLDGGLAAIAYAAVFVAGHRRLPWRAAAIALLVVSPLFVLLWIRFGSVLPNSMVVKVLVHSKTRSMDPLWMHKVLNARAWRALYWGAWISLPWVLLARKLAGSFAVAVVQVWFVLHVLAYSTVNLGGSYPWYTAAPLVHGVILSTFVLHVASSTVLVREPKLRLAWDPASLPRRAWPVSLVALAVLGVRSWPLLSGRLRPPRAPHLVDSGATFDLARQSAGVWLREHTSGTELFSTFEGLPAFEYGGPTFDFSLLNSAAGRGRKLSAVYELGAPLRAAGASFATSEPKTDRELVATFRYDEDDEFYPLYARRTSEIHRNGARHLLFPTPVPVSGGGEPGSENPIERHGNRWLLRGTGLARFGVESPGPPVLLLQLRVARSGDQPAREGDALSWRIGSGGVDVASGELRAGKAPVRVQATARAAEPGSKAAGRYEFEIESRGPSSPETRGILLEASEILVRYGEPLRAEDFKLSTPRCRERVDHVERLGLPSGFFGW